MINPQPELKPDLAGRIGRSVWFDLPAADLADAMSFYQGLLNWQYRQMEDSALSDYVMIEAGGQLIGGLRRVPAASKPAADASGPVVYFTVAKLSNTVSRAKELGGQIVGEMIELGKGRGRYQWIKDREGNLIGLWAPE